MTARRTGKGASSCFPSDSFGVAGVCAKRVEGCMLTLCHRNSRFGPFRGRFEGMRAIGRSHCAG